jgi:hypothetical protein
MQVKIITGCNLYETADENSSVLEVLNFGDLLYVSGDKIEGENFSFYPITKGETNGFVISSFVMDTANTALKRTLDSNAKTLDQSQIYSTASEEDKILINGEEVVLEKFEEIKIIDGYNKSKEFHQILFEIDGEIYTGYIKTSKLLVEGVNSTLIIVIFALVIAGSIAFSIFWTTRKKRKRASKRLSKDNIEK